MPISPPEFNTPSSGLTPYMPTTPPGINYRDGNSPDMQTSPYNYKCNDISPQYNPRSPGYMRFSPDISPPYKSSSPEYMHSSSNNSTSDKSEKNSDSPLFSPATTESENQSEETYNYNWAMPKEQRTNKEKNEIVTLQLTDQINFNNCNTM